MPAVIAPHDDADTNNPNSTLSDTEWPLSSSTSGYDRYPGLIRILGGLEFESHRGNTLCNGVPRGVRSTARHYGAESWEREWQLYTQIN